MPLDKTLIQGKIDIIDRNLEFLTKYKQINEKDFLDNYKDIQAVKYSLFEMIESCIDIASHLIATKGFERAESYSEMFEILGKRKIINFELAENLSNMAKFRNLLIHSYGKIDNLKVLDYIKNELTKIKVFIGKILELIK